VKKHVPTYLPIYLSIYLSIYLPTYLPIYLSTYLRLYSPLLDLGRFFSFLIFYGDSRTSWTGDQPVARPLPRHRTTQTQNKRTQTFMLRVGLEHTIPVFEGSKTVHALDRVATVISPCIERTPQITNEIGYIKQICLQLRHF
jgi:hypothetical protein